MHVHIGAVEFFVFLGYLLIAGFMLRSLAARLGPDNAFAKALAYIY